MKALRFLGEVLVDGLCNSEVLWTVVGQSVKSRMPHHLKMGYERKPAFALLDSCNSIYYDLPTVTNPTSVEAKIELHEARRAGTHLDFRFVYKGRVYDFAVVKTTEFPTKTGVVQRVVRRHNHSLRYFHTDKHVFPEGSYGEGKMNTIWRGDMDIIEMNAEKVEFSINEGPYKGRYCIFTEKSPVMGDAGAMIRMKDPELFHKDRMKFSSDSAKLEAAYSDPDVISQWKLDGANYMLKAGEKPGTNVLISRRLSVTGQPINQAPKIPQLQYLKLPDKFKNRVIHVEVCTAKENVSRTAGILNSNVDRSRAQQRGGDRLVLWAWDIEDSGTYEERLSLLKELQKSSPRADNRLFGDKTDQFGLKRTIFNPKLIAVPIDNRDIKCTPKEFTDLVKNVGGEGTVLKDLKGKYYQDTWLKDKASDCFTLKIIGIKPGEGKYSSSMGALVVQSEDGSITGTVGTGFSDELRLSIWNDRDNLKGVYIEAECHELTSNNVLRGPRFKGFSI